MSNDSSAFPSKLSPTEKRSAFRAILERKTLTVMPGGFSPLYVRLAEQAGFECFFVAGSQVSAFLYGLPDVGVIGLRDVVDHVRHVAARTSIPIFVDADTGYGNAINVHFAVEEFVASGIAGVHIEDQEAPKKSGTSAGRRLISTAEAVGKYRAAVEARDELDPSFVICARCDSIGAEGERFEDALRRCVAYAEDGGVDFVWLNTVQTTDQLAEACETVPAPLLIIWGGSGPEPSLEEYERLGARIVLYPTIAARAGAQAAWEVLSDLAENGQEALETWRKSAMQSRYGLADVHGLVGTNELRFLEERYLPPESQRDYDSTFGHRTVDHAP